MTKTAHQLEFISRDWKDEFPLDAANEMAAEWGCLFVTEVDSHSDSVVWAMSDYLEADAQSKWEANVND